MSYLASYLMQQQTPVSANPNEVSMTTTRTNTDGTTSEVNRSASDVRADLTRAQWADYQQTYQPFEQLSNDAVLDPNRRRELQEQRDDIATDAVNTVYANLAGSNALMRSRYGTQASERTTRSEHLRNAVNHSADLVGARNGSRQYGREMEMRLLGGS